MDINNLFNNGESNPDNLSGNMNNNSGGNMNNGYHDNYYNYNNGYSNSGNSYGNNSYSNSGNSSYGSNNYSDSSYSNGGGGQGEGFAPKDKKNKRKKGPLAVILLVSVVLIVAGVALAYFNDDNGGSGGSDGSYTLEDATGSKLTVAEINQKCADSVVEIKTESVSQDPWLRQYVTEGAGSGVVISKDGYIITNRHVIEEATKVYVTLTNDKTYEATIVGASDTTDIAVVKINPPKDLTPATYGNSEQVKVGDLSVVIGNPLGELGGTVTAGIVSALDRDITLDNQTLKLLQTDAAVNPGNSGGAMFNGDGQLIGIIVAKSGGESVEGLGFAIPINDAARAAQQIIKKGGDVVTANKGGAYSGIQYAVGNDGGIYIQSLLEDNSKKSGLKVGDQVISIDDNAIYDIESVSAIIQSKNPGDTIKFTVSRDGHMKEFKVKLIKQP